jgi:tetratricopeptide (TPR) repeat protein
MVDLLIEYGCMTSIESKTAERKTFFEKLLSLTNNQHQIEEGKTNYSEIEVCNDNQECIRFCKEVSMKWIIKTLPALSDHKSKNEEITRVLGLLGDCLEDCDAQIYAYFLYFCGISFLLQGKKKEENEHRAELRTFFGLQEKHRTDSNIKLLFRFLRVYIDLVDLNKRDISVFKELKDCLANDDDNIIFGAIEEEHKLMEKILFDPIEKEPMSMQKDLQLIRQSSKIHFEREIEGIFPRIDGKYKKYNGKGRIEWIDGKDVIESLTHSGIARLFFIAGREPDHIAQLTKALEAFPHNSFALVQAAHLLVKYRNALEVLEKEKPLDEKDKCLKELFTIIQAAHSAVEVKASNNDYIGASENLFEKVIKLVDDKKQFSDKEFEPFNYRIKFEALLGLAYVYYKKGLGQKADETYTEADKIIRKHLSANADYLKSVTLINRGRNKIDNGPVRSTSTGKEDFKGVLEIYKAAHPEIKDELAEIAARAHNNLGIYYFNEADYERAEKEFRDAIDVDDTNAHARYNLAALYHRKGEEARAIRLFQNASNLDSNFSEARGALEKLGSLKKGGLVSEWRNWWFESKMESKGKIRKRGGRLIMPILAGALIAIMITAFATLAFELYIAGIEYLKNMGNIEQMKPLPDADEGAFIIIIAISIVILMLPFINKLKVSDIEIELETAGFRPEGPASVTAGYQFQDYTIRLPFFFFPRFWYEDT